MKYFLTAALLVTGITIAKAQQPTIIQRDPEIAQMVQEVSADSLQAYIHAMVAYDTRSTLSTQKDPKRGIGAARNWVLSKFNQFASQSGGRLTAYYRYYYV